MTAAHEAALAAEQAEWDAGERERFAAAKAKREAGLYRITVHRLVGAGQTITSSRTMAAADVEAPAFQEQLAEARTRMRVEVVKL